MARREGASLWGIPLNRTRGLNGQIVSDINISPLKPVSDYKAVSIVRNQNWQRNRSFAMLRLYLPLDGQRVVLPEQEGAVARRFYPMLPWVADAGGALLPHAPMWPASRAIYGSVSNSQG